MGDGRCHLRRRGHVRRRRAQAHLGEMRRALDQGSLAASRVAAPQRKRGNRKPELPTEVRRPQAALREKRQALGLVLSGPTRAGPRLGIDGDRRTRRCCRIRGCSDCVHRARLSSADDPVTKSKLDTYNQPSDCIQMVDSKRPPPVSLKLERPQQCPFNLAGPSETARTLLSVV